ncbi:hypothetical protein [Pseudomonas yamanorum]|uniref:hypothetical protein n=1 Tax=Pseudomonas yamanorum TaxID=515393 RepID=UPI003D36A1F8
MTSTYDEIELIAIAQQKSTMTIKGEFYYAASFKIALLNKGEHSISFKPGSQLVLLGRGHEKYYMHACDAKIFSTADPYMESTGDAFFISKNEEIYNAVFITLETDTATE